VADIVRAAGDSFFQNSRKWLTWLHLKVLNAILLCRTAALGGHVDACSKCGHEAVSFNSCRNRHCPKCQANARDRWLEARGKDLLPTRYVHVVFTLPRQLSPLALQNKPEIYALLFRASAETLPQVARDPKHLGAEIGFFSVLHTWNQKLQHHPHVHCVVPAGGLAPDHSRWIDSQQKFFLPVGALKEVFRGKFVKGLRKLQVEHKLAFHGTLTPLQNPKAFAAWLRPLFRAHGWSTPNVLLAARNMRFAIWASTPSGGDFEPSPCLARRRHRHFPLARFRTQKQETPDDIARRRAPIPAARVAAWIRIRHFGFLAHRRRRALLPLCIRLLAESGRTRVEAAPEGAAPSSPPMWTCPQCGGPMVLTGRLSAVELRLRSPPVPAAQQP
jgi:Transposase zinc-binding domain/Putative transposase